MYYFISITYSIKIYICCILYCSTLTWTQIKFWGCSIPPCHSHIPSLCLSACLSVCLSSSIFSLFLYLYPVRLVNKLLGWMGVEKKVRNILSYPELSFLKNGSAFISGGSEASTYENMYFNCLLKPVNPRMAGNKKKTHFLKKLPTSFFWGGA